MFETDEIKLALLSTVQLLQLLTQNTFTSSCQRDVKNCRHSLNLHS